MEIGSRIKTKRKEKRLTQIELAKLVNVSSQVISNWERGYSDLSSDDVARLADVLSCSTEYLLGKSPSRNHKETDLMTKDEKDIAKRLKEFKKDLTSTDGLNFSGEPMSEDAKESLIEAMDHLFRQTQRINKKYIPKKHRKDED